MGGGRFMKRGKDGTLVQDCVIGDHLTNYEYSKYLVGVS